MNIDQNFIFIKWLYWLTLILVAHNGSSPQAEMLANLSLSKYEHQPSTDDGWLLPKVIIRRLSIISSNYISRTPGKLIECHWILHFRFSSRISFYFAIFKAQTSYSCQCFHRVQVSLSLSHALGIGQYD